MDGRVVNSKFKEFVSEQNTLFLRCS